LRLGVMNSLFLKATVSRIPRIAARTFQTGVIGKNVI
jgi:hypothetical protein